MNNHDHSEAMKGGILHNQSLSPHSPFGQDVFHAQILADQAALIAAEEFALSMVPLLIVVNEVGGIAKAITILKAAKG